MGRLLEEGYHGGRLSLLSLGGRWGPSSSSPLAGHPERSTNLAGGSLVLGTPLADNLSVITFRTLVCVASPNDASTPILLPTDRVTLPPIKTGDNYLQTRDLVLFWLCSLGSSMARLDELLLTDAWNSLASQFWEGQLWTALKDGPVRFLFENTCSTFYGKGFEMLQVLKDHFRPSSISNSFTSPLALFNNMQGEKESIHEFCSRFEGHMGALSCLSVAIPPILQVVLFLWGMHSLYQDLLSQFALKHKDLSLATIDSIVAGACFMDEFVVVGGTTKPGVQGPSPCSPSAASVVTNKEGKEFCTPWEWLASYDLSALMSWWGCSLRGNFYCVFCNRNNKHHPLKCPLLGELGLKIIEVGGQGSGATPGSSSGAGKVKPASASPPELRPQRLCLLLFPILVPLLLLRVQRRWLSQTMVGTKVQRTTFYGMGMMTGPPINLTSWFPTTSRRDLGSRLSPFLHLLPTLDRLYVAHHTTLRLWVMTLSSLRTCFLSPPCCLSC